MILSFFEKCSLSFFYKLSFFGAEFFWKYSKNKPVRAYPEPILFTPSQNLMKNWYFCFDFVSPYSKLLLNWDRILSFVCFLPISWQNKVYYAHPEANIFLLSFESSKSDQWIQRYNFLCIVTFDCCFTV